MTFLDWLVPSAKNGLTQGKAGLIILACFVVATALLFLLITWKISKDLQKQTAAAALLAIIALSGITYLARAGQIVLAAWALIALLGLSLVYDTFHYGLKSLSASALLFPILLGGFCLGLWAALALAFLSTTTAWITAWKAIHRPGTHLQAADPNQLSFFAPSLTVLYFIVAVLSGAWSDYLIHMASQ